jgi:hypothetical protein
MKIAHTKNVMDSESEKYTTTDTTAERDLGVIK